MSNTIKICAVGSDLFHADRRTAMETLISIFLNFAKAPEKVNILLSLCSAMRK